MYRRYCRNMRASGPQKEHVSTITVVKLPLQSRRFPDHSRQYAPGRVTKLNFKTNKNHVGLRNAICKVKDATSSFFVFAIRIQIHIGTHELICVRMCVLN